MLLSGEIHDPVGDAPTIAVVRTMPFTRMRPILRSSARGVTVTRATRVDEIDFTYDLRSYDLAQWNSLVGRSRMEIIGTVREDASEIEATEPGYAIFLLRPRSTARR